MPSTADLIAAIKRRWRLETAIFVAILLLISIWTALTPRTYEATSSLLFDDAIDPVETVARPDDVGAMLATQADVIQSESIAADVSRTLQLTPPAIVDLWRQQTGGTGDVNIWRGRQLLRDLEVEPSRGSRVLSIKYKSPDPDYAAGIANGFTAAYLDARLRQKTDPARTYSRWFEDRTREVRGRLEKAQAALTAFQRKSGIVDTGTVNAETDRLAGLSGQLVGAESVSADLGARAGGAVSEGLDVQSSGVVQGLRSSIAAKDAQVSQIASIYGPNHPDRIAAEAELRELRNKLASEIASSARSVRIASSTAVAREADLRGRLNGQRSRMLTLASDRAQLDVLSRDVESARSAYDAVTQRLGTMRLQSEAPASNARLLDTATPPVLPATPNVPLRVILGALLAALVALGVGAILEFIRPRVRTASGLLAKGGLPVIARIDFDRSRIAPLLAARAAS